MADFFQVLSAHVHVRHRQYVGTGIAAHGRTSNVRIERNIWALSIILATGCRATAPLDDESQSADLYEETHDGESLDQASLDEIFHAAAEEFDVPVELLKSIGWVETGWQMIQGDSEFPGQPRAYGIMGLRGEQLEEGALEADVTLEEARTNPEANIRAAAALLSLYGDELAIDRTELGSWARATAAFSGIEDEQAQAFYIHNEVYKTLREGVASELTSIEPLEVVPVFAMFNGNTSPGPNYAKSIWRPSPNYSSRPSGTAGVPQMVIIHTCEGSYSGCWSWLSNANSGVSAHYVVNATGSEITQLVNESKKAWHIGATYKCSLNNSTKCNLNGTSGNNFTIGIEHAGYASQASWATGLIDASAELVCDISKDNNIPRDKYHIVGHGQLQPYNRVDPGPNWPWNSYLSKVNTFCNGGGGGGQTEPPPSPAPSGSQITVDSNNALNPSNAKCLVSGNWTASNNVAGYYQTGYWWRSTGSTSDLAEFRVYLDAPKTMQIQVWYPAASDRSTTAPFIIFDGNGQQLDVKYVNQQANGGKWVTLGTYNLTVGWNSVALSRWTTPGYVVVADAVRFTQVQ
jgi:N-acetyl-anhydromuramyl-L-alanine amidase AmpD